MWRGQLLTVLGSAWGRRHGGCTVYIETHGMPDWPENLVLTEDQPPASTGTQYALMERERQRDRERERESERETERQRERETDRETVSARVRHFC